MEIAQLYKRTEYLNLRVVLEQDSDDTIMVRLTGPGGSAAYPIKATIKDLQCPIDIDAATSGDLNKAVSYGRHLHRTIFLPDRLDVVRKSLNLAGAENKGLRLLLTVSPPQLANLPWELLYNPAKDDYFGQSARTPLLRFEETIEVLLPPTAVPPLRVLMVISQPSDVPAVMTDQELPYIVEAWEKVLGVGATELVEPTTMLGGRFTPSWRDLRDCLEEAKACGQHFHIVHFTGHGGYDRDRQQGYVLMTDPTTGQAEPLYAKQLANLLEGFSIRFVFLNVCNGGNTASALVRNGIPVAISMQSLISDRAAVELAREVYDGLARSLPVDVAVARARMEIDRLMGNTLEWAIPVVATQCADGVTFRVTRHLIIFSERAGDMWVNKVHALAREIKAYDARIVRNIEELRTLLTNLSSPGFLFTDVSQAERLLNAYAEPFDEGLLYLIALTSSPIATSRRRELERAGVLLIDDFPNNEQSFRELLDRARQQLARWFTHKVFIVQPGLEDRVDVLVKAAPHGYEVRRIARVAGLRRVVQTAAGKRSIVASVRVLQDVHREIGDLVDDDMVQLVIMRDNGDSHATTEDADPAVTRPISPVPVDVRSSREMLDAQLIRHNWFRRFFGWGGRADAWVSEPEPSSNSFVTVFGSLQIGGRPVVGATMTSYWQYKSVTHPIRGGATGPDGIARVGRRIGTPTPGHEVRVRVRMTYEGKSYDVSTGFVPRD